MPGILEFKVSTRYEETNIRKTPDHILSFTCQMEMQQFVKTQVMKNCLMIPVILSSVTWYEYNVEINKTKDYFINERNWAVKEFLILMTEIWTTQYQPICLALGLTNLGFPEAVTQRCFVKKVFLETSQKWQQNTYARVSFLIKLPANLLKKILCYRCCPVNFLKFSKNTFSCRTPLVAASRFYQTSKISDLNNSQGVLVL